MTDPYNSLGEMDPNRYHRSPVWSLLVFLQESMYAEHRLNYIFSALPRFERGALWSCTIPPGYGHSWS